MKAKEPVNIEQLLRVIPPKEIVKYGYDTELEDWLHDNGENLDDATTKQIMKALRMIA